MTAWKEWNGRDVIKKFRSECSDAMYKAGQTMKTQVVKEIPLDEGTQQDTVISMIDPSDELTVVVAAGGGGASGMPQLPYTVKQHETEMNYQHGRKSQFIRDPLKQVMPKAIKHELGLKGLK